MTDEQVKRQLDLMSAKTDTAIAKEYVKARNAIKAELSWYYEKYSIDGVLTYNEMSKYGRLDKLLASIDEEMNVLGVEVDNDIKRLTKESYGYAYTEYGASFENQYGASINFGQIRPEDLRSLINEPNVSGESLSQTLSANRYNDLILERKAITQGFLKGESYVKMAKRIQESMGKSFNDAIRISRTEAGRAASEGQDAVYQQARDMGIEFVRVWSAANQPLRTRITHQELDGDEEDKNGYFYSSSGDKARFPHDFSLASENINCRCSVKAVIKKD